MRVDRLGAIDDGPAPAPGFQSANIGPANDRGAMDAHVVLGMEMRLDGENRSATWFKGSESRCIRAACTSGRRPGPTEAGSLTDRQPQDFPRNI